MLDRLMDIIGDDEERPYIGRALSDIGFPIPLERRLPKDKRFAHSMYSIGEAIKILPGSSVRFMGLDGEFWEEESIEEEIYGTVVIERNGNYKDHDTKEGIECMAILSYAEPEIDQDMEDYLQNSLGGEFENGWLPYILWVDSPSCIEPQEIPEKRKMN